MRCVGGGSPVLILNGATSLAPFCQAAISRRDTTEVRRALDDLIAAMGLGRNIAVVSIGRDKADTDEAAYTAGEVVLHPLRRGLAPEPTSCGTVNKPMQKRSKASFWATTRSCRRLVPSVSRVCTKWSLAELAG